MGLVLIKSYQFPSQVTNRLIDEYDNHDVIGTFPFCTLLLQQKNDCLLEYQTIVLFYLR